MAADLAQLEAALVKADAAGDAAGARLLAGEVRKMRDFASLKKEGAPTVPQAYQPSGEKNYSYTDPQNLAAHPLTRFATGVAAPFIGAGQLAANAVGAGTPVNEHLKQFNDMTQHGRANLGSTGMDWWNAGGQALSPAYLKAAGAIPNASGAAGRIGQGVGLGAAGGAAQPVYDQNNYWGDKSLQVGTGAALGGLVPAGWEGAKAVGRGVRNVAQPYMGQWGADQAAGRLANTAANGRSDAVIGELDNPVTHVPGSNPTAGQAAAPANSAEFSALQTLAAERKPSAYYGPGGIEGEQNRARVAALRTVGQDKTALDSAVSKRSADAAQNYGAAYAQQIKGDPALLKMAQNPYLKEAMADATKLAEANGINPKTDLTQYLHYVKVSLDKQLLKSGDTALGATEKRAVQDLQSELIGWMGKKNPAYDSARSNFAAQSKPINQMEVGQYLEQKLTPALSEESKQRSASFAQALRDAPGTIKRSTGNPRFDELSQVLEPQQMQAVGNVHKDLARDALVKELSQKGLPAARQRIGEAVPEAPPTGMFSPIISVARGAYNRATGKATDKIMDDLAVKMQDPQEMARIMRSAKPFERRALVDAMNRYQAATVPQAVNQGAQ